MAKPGDTLEMFNGEVRIKFTETESSSQGETLAFEYAMGPGRGYLRPHNHIGQVEHYVIVSGVATYMQDGVEKTAKAGDVITNSPGQGHINPWNRDGDGELVVNVRAHPAMGVEYFFETWFGLVRDGRNINPKTNELNLLQNILTINNIPAETFDPNIPEIFQRFAYRVIGLAAQLRGYQPFYPEYTDIAAATNAQNLVKPIKPEHLTYNK